MAAVLDTLVERKLIRIAGRKETIGRPLLYATTPDFLKAFGLKKLEELPAIETLKPPTSSPEPELFTDGVGTSGESSEATSELNVTAVLTDAPLPDPNAADRQN